jgi:hypothetical protein
MISFALQGSVVVFSRRPCGFRSGLNVAAMKRMFTPTAFRTSAIHRVFIAYVSALILHITQICIADGSVCIVTGYWADGQSSIPWGEGQDFSRLRNIQTISGAHLPPIH